MNAQLTVDALRWADMVMEASLFLVQTYLTDVWKLSFASAATCLNIWGGISRILPIFFLFLSDTILGNVTTLALSTIFSTTGLALITGSTWRGYGCKGKEECVTRAEKVLFVIGMAVVALGMGARSASSKPFLHIHTTKAMASSPIRFCLLSSLSIMPVIQFIVFPYIKQWYVLFGLSAICSALATLFLLKGFRKYKAVEPQRQVSPLIAIFSVFVAAAFNICRSFPKDETKLYRKDDGDEEFQAFSSSRILGCLNKAAIIPPDDASGAQKRRRRRWRLCSVSEVESAKIMIRLCLVNCSYLIYGVVASTADTYLVEQASNLNTHVGAWKLPPQIIAYLFIVYKEYFNEVFQRSPDCCHNNTTLKVGMFTAVISAVHCAVAAAVERRRLHIVRRYDLLNLPNVKNSMSCFYLTYQVLLLGWVELSAQKGLSHFYDEEAPESMKRYSDCLSEAVTGIGFICASLVVYVVGEITQTRGGKGWFRQTLNESRLDRYYWLLAVLSSINLVVFIVVIRSYRSKRNEDILCGSRKAPGSEPKEIEGLDSSATTGSDV